LLREDPTKAITDVVVTVSVPSDKGQVDIFPGKYSSWMSNLAVYALHYCMPDADDKEACADFAFQRVIVARHKLFANSDEITRCDQIKSVHLDDAAIARFKTRLAAPTLYYVTLFTSLISFLKSGHHATMFGIVGTLQKMCRAINVQHDNTRIASLIKSCVYWGSHVAETRLATYFLMSRAQNEKLSRAIVSRINPAPPTYSAVCNLELFIDSLNAAGFFTFTNKTHQYDKFKIHMEKIRRVMHYASPYSMYLYGLSEPEPEIDRTEAMKFAAYASAINDVLPNSTLGLSPSLQKAAQLANVNSIEANLIVSAYANAFRRFFKAKIAGQMSRTLGNDASEIE
jgi:hypothetical protein